MIRTRNSPRVRVRADTGDPAQRAKQSFRDECDINVLMARYLKGGVISHLNPREAQFLDVSEVGDLRSVYERLEDAREAFEGLPSEVREHFEHDPLEFVEFALDEENRDQLSAWGLLIPESQNGSGGPPDPGLEEAESEPGEGS